MHDVIAMRELMRRSEAQLKFVLAGLHSVQRFLHLPNQPFAQLGKPIPIGPLHWESAERLVTEPMRALGFEFEDYVVDRILTLTSRHPSLIQHVCRALVDHLSRRPRRTVPLTVSLADLDAVYEDQGLRREIRKRFDWTLDLDPRYRVLAYTLAFESRTNESARIKGLSAVELQTESIRWWPEGFSNLSRDQITTLCDEMVELRVFYAADGRYRLWSPNVLELLGTGAEIEERLLNDGGRERTSTIDAGSDRRPVGLPSELSRSPFTYEEENRLLAAAGPPIRLVFGTSAVHVDRVISGLVSLSRSPDWPDVLVKEHRQVPRPREVAADASVELTVHVCAASGVDADWLYRRIGKLVEGSQSGSVLVIVLDERTLSDWEPLLAELTLDEALSGSVRDVQLRQWDVESVRFWLDDMQMPTTSPDERAAIIATTGGWPILLERFIQVSRGNALQLTPSAMPIRAGMPGCSRAWA